MPELPEVEALVGLLREQAVGQVVARVDVSTISVLKTYDPPVTALGGLMITAAARHGKFLDLDCDGLHFVTHLARGGCAGARSSQRLRPVQAVARSPCGYTWRTGAASI